MSIMKYVLLKNIPILRTLSKCYLLEFIDVLFYSPQLYTIRAHRMIVDNDSFLRIFNGLFVSKKTNKYFGISKSLDRWKNFKSISRNLELFIVEIKRIKEWKYFKIDLKLSHLCDKSMVSVLRHMLKIDRSCFSSFLVTETIVPNNFWNL